MRFEIVPNLAENQRACVSIARAVLPPDRTGFTIIVLYAAVWAAAAYLTPSTTAITATIGMIAIMSTITLRRLDLVRLGRLSQSRDPHAQETYSVEVSSDGVRTWCAHVDARYPWSDFARVVENAEFVLFARPSGVGVALPKRVLGTMTAQELLDLVQTWAPQLDIARAN